MRKLNLNVGERLLTVQQIRQKLGNCSTMHIWRLRKAPDYQHLKFPKPIIKKGRPYWREEALDRWFDTFDAPSPKQPNMTVANSER